MDNVRGSFLRRSASASISSVGRAPKSAALPTAPAANVGDSRPPPR